MLRRTRALWLLFLLAVSLPLVVRARLGAPITPLDSSYVHLASNNSLYDSLLILLPGPFLPVILGILSFFLLTRLEMKSYALILFIITPLTITMFTTHNDAALFFPLTLLAYFAYKLNPYAALVAIPLLVQTDTIAAIVVTLLFIAYTFRTDRALAGFSVVILAAMLHFSNGFGHHAPNYAPLFGEFGSATGYSVFILLLAGVFVVQHWRTIDAAYVLGWLGLFVLSGYVPTLRPLVLIPLVLYAGEALQDLNWRKYQLQFMKQASYLLLICLGIFVLITHAKLLAYATPQAPLVNLVEYANEDPRYGSILVTTDYDDAARHYSSRLPIAGFSPEDRVWQAISVTQARTYTSAYDVRFILVTPGMIHGEVWNRDEGLRFLMQNNEKFIKVEEENGYELWLVLQEFI